MSDGTISLPRRGLSYAVLITVLANTAATAWWAATETAEREANTTEISTISKEFRAHLKDDIVLATAQARNETAISYMQTAVGRIEKSVERLIDAGNMGRFK